jgi:putative endonuclease
LNGKREHTRRTAGRRAAQQRGARAEQRAALYLRLKGYRILARGYRTPVGEIDLLAARGRLLAAVEVKSRGDRDTAAFSISPRQQARVARATEHYLAANPRYAAYRIRFDAILDTPWRLPKHIRDAWRIT